MAALRQRRYRERQRQQTVVCPVETPAWLVAALQATGRLALADIENRRAIGLALLGFVAKQIEAEMLTRNAALLTDLLPWIRPKEAPMAESIKVQVMHECWCSEKSVPFLPSPTDDRENSQRRKLPKGAVVDLHPDDAEALKRFVRRV
jgi:hypothetical protein